MRVEEIRTGLAIRLRARLPEIEQATLTRVYAVSDPGEGGDPLYREGLRAAVAAAIGYHLDAVERGGDRALPIPTRLLSQARLAARSGVSLETMLRRYFAGYTLFSDFLIEEAEGSMRGAALKRVLRAQAALLDRVIGALSEEYGRESAPLESSEARRADRIERLLEGELVDPTALGYELDCWHLGLVAVGTGAVKSLRELARSLDRPLLLGRQDGETVWAWFGAREKPDLEVVERAIAAGFSSEISLGAGEPGQGLVGWRLSHRQARAAMPIALRGPRRLARYGEVALLAAMLKDDLLATSFRRSYLDPLAGHTDDGTVLRETLRAYFGAERQISSAAAVLGVSRQAVSKRLRVAEALIGRPLGDCGVELESALRLDELVRKSPSHPDDRSGHCAT